MADLKIDRRDLLISAIAGCVAGSAPAQKESSRGRAKGADKSPLRLSEFLRQPDSQGADDATSALVAAMRQAVRGARTLVIDGRFSIQANTVIPGAIQLHGRPGQGDGFDLRPAPADVRGGLHGHLILEPSRDIDGINFRDLTFRGGYDSGQWSGSTVVPMFRASPRKGVTHQRIMFERCRFIDPATDCIQCAPVAGGTVLDVKVVDCEADVSVGLDRSSRTANLVRTILEYQDWPGHKNSYGQIGVERVSISRCKARGIRTLADLKRGTADFLVVDCYTEDMSDCHHSADGAFRGRFMRLRGVQRSSLLPTKNFIEVQGEYIDIEEFTYSASPELGAIAGVMVTAYAFPLEGRGGVHQSRKIKISRGMITGVAHHAIRMIDAADCAVHDITIDKIKYSAVSIEHAAGSSIVPRKIVVNGIRKSQGRKGTGVTVSAAARDVTLGSISGFERASIVR